MMEKSTETAEPSSWKLMNSRLTAMELPWDQTALHMLETVVKVGLSVRHLAVGPESISGP